MIINGNYFHQTANATYGSESTHPVDSLAAHMKEEKIKEATDSVNLSPEAYAALKEYAPEALQALGIDADNPVLDEVKEIAKEKFFHFGTKYLKLPETEDEIISALDVANRYMDALNSIEPDELYEALEDSNIESADSFDSMESFSRLLEYV